MDITVTEIMELADMQADSDFTADTPADQLPRNLLERKIQEIFSHIAGLEAQARQCGAGANCCAQAARIEALQAQLDAVGAGGVTALMAAPAQPATPTHAGGLSEQDCGLLEQAASMLDALANDERNRGNCSTAEGADYCAHAVRRLASAPAQPLTDGQIDRAIAELGLNYLADAHETNRSVLRKLCHYAHGIAAQNGWQPRDDAVFVVWWSDHMPNSTEADAWAEWCALRSNQPAAQAQAGWCDGCSPDNCGGCMTSAAPAQVQAMLSHGIAPGWKLVPAEPTKEMVIEAYKAQGEATSSACKEIYRAMLAAAPQPAAQAGWCDGCSPDNCGGCSPDNCGGCMTSAAPAQAGEPWYGHKFKEPQSGIWRCECGKTVKEATADWLDSVLEDAARYRWLRINAIGAFRTNDGNGPVSVYHLSKIPAIPGIPEETDAAIDAAIAAQQGEKHE